MTLIMVIAVIAIFIGIDGLRIYLKKKKAVAGGVFQFKPFRSLEMPLGIFLNHSHFWVRLNDSGEFRVGLDELVLQAIKDIDKIELASSGTPVRKGDKFGKIIVKGRVMDLRSPVSGTVISENDSVTADPSALNEDPYFSGWLIKIWPTDPKESIKSMMIGESARKWMQREIQRFADFLALRATPALGEALADGAKPVIGALQFVDEKGWDEFEKEFMKDTEQ